MRSLSIALCQVACVLVAFGLAAFAQSDRGTITGTVSDPAGAVIGGAAVEARNVATDAVYPVATSATGNFTIAQLDAFGSRADFERRVYALSGSLQSAVDIGLGAAISFLWLSNGERDRRILINS